MGGAGTDETTRHLAEQARTLRGVLLTGAVVLSGLTVMALLSGGDVGNALFAYGLGAALHVAHLLALRAGRTRAVAISHCVSYLIWITAVLAFQVGGLRAPAALVYPPIVLLAGLVWSGRAAVGMALVSSLAALALVVMDSKGLIHPKELPLTPMRLWFILTGCVVITGVILRFALGIIQRSTAEALQDLRARIAAEEEKERLQEQLRQVQRLEALGRMAGGVAHDVNNILTIIMANTELIPERSAGTAERVSEIQSAARKAAELTQRLLAFGRRQVMQNEVIDVDEVVNELGPMLRRLIPTGVTMNVHSSF